MSRNIFKRLKADVVFAGSNYIQVVQPVSPEVQQLPEGSRAARPDRGAGSMTDYVTGQQIARARSTPQDDMATIVICDQPPTEEERRTALDTAREAMFASFRTSWAQCAVVGSGFTPAGSSAGRWCP